jgi:hypothetical protein
VTTDPRRSPRAARALALATGSALALVAALAAAADAQAPAPGAADDDDEMAPPAPAPASTLAALERAYRAEVDDRKRVVLVGQMTGLPGAGELLARIVEQDRSDDVALAAAYALRRAAVGNVVRLLEGRAQKTTRDGAARKRLLREIERHQVLAAGQNLPHFLREAPPAFVVKGADRRNVRALAFGDFGNGSERQSRMAEAMARYHGKHRFDFAITLGDNFYPAGMTSPVDSRWERDFERLYAPMHIKFFASLGNHDWILTDSPAAEILRSTRSKVWQMPAGRYSFVAGPVQFFAIDTNLLTRAHLDWLDGELGASRARWKIVYGHHPIYSAGFHGDQAALRENLLPLLRGRVQLYVSGHDHDLQHLQPDGGVHFVIAGGGGVPPRPITAGPRSLFAASKGGFAVIEGTRRTLTVMLVDEALETVHRFALSD